MTHLASIDLEVCTRAGTQPEEKRIELRIISTDTFVAWFQINTRISSEERVVSANTHFVRRKELTNEQVVAVTKWLREQVLAAI
jgi:hypothetical protein